MPSGTIDLDFGAFPGAVDASVAVTGQTGIVSGSLVEAWLRPVATSDRSADEAMLEPLRVVAGNIVAGTGFTIYGFCTESRDEFPSRMDPPWQGGRPAAGPQAGPGKLHASETPAKGVGTRLHGKFTIAWAWA